MYGNTLKHLMDNQTEINEAKLLRQEPGAQC